MRCLHRSHNAVFHGAAPSGGARLCISRFNVNRPRNRYLERNPIQNLTVSNLETRLFGLGFFSRCRTQKFLCRRSRLCFCRDDSRRHLKTLGRIRFRASSFPSAIPKLYFFLYFPPPGPPRWTWSVLRKFGYQGSVGYGLISTSAFTCREERKL